MSANRAVETVVVGAGQAGLVMSSLLTSAGREHVVLDRRTTLGGGWQDRWDAFQLVTPNWTVGVPGMPYDGPDPDGFMGREALIDWWRRYAAAIDAPVELGVDVTGLEALNGDAGAARFRLDTSRGLFLARDVIVAGGPFGRPFVPPIGDGFDRSIRQLHANDYRNPDALSPGGVLLVGSGQTGVQLAEELLEAGRSVVLSVGRCGRVPRRYRGRDIFWWLRALATRGRELGMGLPTPAELPGPRARLACNPQLSGHGEPHDIDLRRIAAERGLRLAGRMEGASGTRARFATDLGEKLAFADGFFSTMLQGRIDAFAERLGEGDEPAPHPTFPHDPPEVSELDLAAEGIATVIWTSGYRPAYEWIRLPVLDEVGIPIQVGGRSEVPGLSFIGTPWLVDMGSANLVGLARDAEALAASW